MISSLKNINFDSVKRIYKYFYPYVIKFRGKLLLAIISGLGVMSMELLKPWPLKIIFDGLLFNDGRVQQYPVLSLFFQKGTEWVLAVTCIGIIVIALLKGMFTYHEELLTADVGYRTVASIRRKLYNHLLKLSRSFHDHRKSGDLLVRLTGDMTLLKEMLVNFIVTATGWVMVLVGMIIIMLAIDWQLTLMAIFTVPALMFSITTYTRKIKTATVRARRKEGKVASIAHESLHSISMIQAFSLEQQQSDRFSEYNKSNLRAGLKSRRLMASFQRIVELLLALGSCVVMWFGVQRVLDGRLSPGDLIVFTSYMRDMYRPLRRLSQLTSRLGKATACGERILEILDMKPVIRSSRKAIEVPSFKGEICFRNVHFSYNGNDNILSGINFKIEPGHTVALVGASGAGKTTILNLLLRFYEPQEGRIEIDGYNIKKISLESLREQISVIMHEPYLLGTTIRENIAMGKPGASLEEIERAARIANAHEFIVAMEDGYNTKLSEAGSILSRGQQQRIALARTAIRDTPIIILDEPTTGLDTQSELLVIDTLNNLMRDRTCIIIVHRFSTIKSSDRILVLDEGEIIEDGDHATLMQRSSRYKEIYALQVTQNS